MSTTLEHWKRLVTQKHLFYRPSFTFQWTDELDARLRECIEEGLSYGRINILLGLSPDDAVIGRWWWCERAHDRRG
ncbi:GcrA family cell cycle regulator [Aeromonas veronii]|uniref:GcrA family cell cycle regulator n=1 Tax=Aeromonas veronii TaxID=654 RepID=UPI001F2E3F9E|nr:GcrA family cell cycle regulator [Aeromonas veronii]MCF7742387.1 hypothetical protein [Aeromonas veronii]